MSYFMPRSLCHAFAAPWYRLCDAEEQARPYRLANLVNSGIRILFDVELVAWECIPMPTNPQY